MAYGDFVRAKVLAPLNMTNSTWGVPMPSAFQSQAAYAYVKPETPVSTQWNAYPQLAAAGLWATPTDIAKLLIEVGNALANNGAVLTTASAVAMLSPVDNFQYGLGGADPKHRPIELEPAFHEERRKSRLLELARLLPPARGRRRVGGVHQLCLAAKGLCVDLRSGGQGDELAEFPRSSRQRTAGRWLNAVRAGFRRTLDDSSLYGAPRMAIYPIDKQAFYMIPEGVPTFERAPPLPAAAGDPRRAGSASLQAVATATPSRRRSHAARSASCAGISKIRKTVQADPKVPRIKATNAPA
jgi:Beta-lactamase